MPDTTPPPGTARNGRIAMISGGSLERDAKLARLATLAGCTPLPMDDTLPADFLLIDLSSETDRLTDTLLRITDYLQKYRSTALIWSKMESLEVIYAALPQGQCHFLVNADDVEAMPILAGAFGRGGMDRLHDRDQEVEFRSLHQISDELAEFARTLARMADPELKDKIQDKSISYRAAPLGGFQGFPNEKSATKDVAVTLRLREVIKLRRLRGSRRENSPKHLKRPRKRNQRRKNPRPRRRRTSAIRWRSRSRTTTNRSAHFKRWSSRCKKTTWEKK